MNPTPEDSWERSLVQIAHRFDYPPTPRIAVTTGRESAVGRTSRHRRAAGLAWAMLVLALCLSGLLAVPRTRAAVLSFIARIGAIDIFIDEGASTPEPAILPNANPTPSPAPGSTSGRIDHSLELFELGRATTLNDALQMADFPLAVPALLGEPDEVYVHTGIDLPAATLVWRQADGSALSLTEIGVPAFANKMIHEEGIEETTVGDRPAVWLAGPHVLQLLGNWEPNTLLIDSNVLVWADSAITYRLEGDLSLEEARRIAASVTSAGE